LGGILIQSMALDISCIRVLCFDVDGTLRDTDDQMVNRISRWLFPLRFLFPDGNPIPFSRWLVMSVETPANFIYGIPDIFGVDDELVKFAEIIRKLRSPMRRQKEYLVIPGVFQALERFVRYYPLTVVSARDQLPTQAFLDQANLTTFFKHIVTAQTCPRTKPYPDPIFWVAGQFGVSPENCLMIGDTTVDIRAGKAAGAQTVGVLCGFGTERELRSCGADLVVPSISDLAEILLRDG
jgi:HAD superfamily hydrolase (TIGR01549 family)